MSDLAPNDIWNGFKEFFDCDRIFAHRELTILRGHYEFDLLAFETWLEKHGYRLDQEGSIADFILRKYGRDAMNFISNLLTIS